MTNEEAIYILKNTAWLGTDNGIKVYPAIKKAIEALEKADKYRWHDLRKNPHDLPPSRGDGGFVPDSYEFVAIYNKGTDDEIIAQGQGWLNDVWKDGTGFVLIAKQLTSKELAYYPDKPIEFSYSQLIAWREKEPFEGEKE